MVALRGKLRPDFVDDNRYTSAWWGESTTVGPPAYQWRSYTRHREEVARILLSFRFSSHSLDLSTPAVMVWSFEVREDLRCSGAHVGTTIVNQLVGEYCDRKIYIGPTRESETFWARFGWPMCDCDRCRGSDFIVRRP
jgi:hypothetical protein